MFDKRRFEIYPELYSRLGMVVDSWNSSTWETDARDSGLQCHPWDIVISKPTWAIWDFILSAQINTSHLKKYIKYKIYE